MKDRLSSQLGSLQRDTSGPPVCTQVYVSVLPFGIRAPSAGPAWTTVALGHRLVGAVTLDRRAVVVRLDRGSPPSPRSSSCSSRRRPCSSNVMSAFTQKLRRGEAWLSSQLASLQRDFAGPPVCTHVYVSVLALDVGAGSRHPAWTTVALGDRLVGAGDFDRRARRCRPRPWIATVSVVVFVAPSETVQLERDVRIHPGAQAR